MSARRGHLVDLSGLPITIDGADRDAVEGLTALWRSFLVQDTGNEVWLRVAVESGTAGDALHGSSNEKGLDVSRGVDGAITVRMAEGRATVASDGRTARIQVTPRAAGETRTWAAQNLLLPVLAWTLATRRGGGVVHGAAVVVDGRAFLLVGPAGAGKSTFARLAAERGEVVLGEDLAVIDAADGLVEVLGSPFRVEHATRTGPGRWPLAGVLVPRHADRPSIEPVSRLRAASTLSANLPYLDPEAAAGVVDGVLARVPARRLAFRPDPSFLDLLDRFDARVGPDR